MPAAADHVGADPHDEHAARPTRPPLTATRAVALIGPDPAEQAAVLARLRHDPEARELGDSVLVLDLRAGATEAAVALVGGVVREVAVLGARGDGKTVTGALAWMLFAHCCRESTAACCR